VRVPLWLALTLAGLMGCAGSSGPPPDVTLDLQGFRGLERDGDRTVRVFRSGEAPVLLARPAGDGEFPRAPGLAAWIVGVDEPGAGWSLGTGGGTDTTGTPGFDTVGGVLRAVVDPDDLGIPDDETSTLVFVAWTEGDRRAERFVTRNLGAAPPDAEWPEGVVRATFPVRVASKGARAAGASEAVAACRQAYREEPDSVPALCVAAAETEQPRDRMLALERLGFHARRGGRLDDARRRFESAAEAAAAAGLPSEQTTELRLASLACREAGDLSAARELGERALAVDVEQGHMLWQARDHTMLGLVLHGLGEPGAAVAHLERAVEADRLLARPYDEGIAITDLAMVYRSSGRYRHALAALDRAEPLFEPRADASDHDREAWATYLGNRGWTLLRARRHGLLPATSEELETSFETALAIHRDAGRVLWVANELMNLATLALQDGDAPTARARIAEARQVLGDDLSFEHRGYLLALEGELALVEMDPSAAMDAFSELEEVEGRWSARWWADFGRARAHVIAGRPDAADAAFEQALDALEGAAATLDPLVDRPYFLGDRDEVYDAYLLHLLDRGRVTAALAVSERSRSREQRRARSGAGLADADGLLVDAVVRARNALQRHEDDETFLRTEQRGDWERERRERVEDLVEAQAALVAAEWAAVGEEQAPGSEALDMPGLFAGLPSGSRLLLYHTTVEELVLFDCRGPLVRAHRIDAGRLQLAERVEALRTAVAAGGGAAEAEALEPWLLPSEVEIDAERLLVLAPHGPLHGLSFPTLRRGGRYLVEDHPLAVVPGLAALGASLGRPACEGGETWVAADPAGDLPAARDEGAKVASLRSGSTLVLSDGVDRGAVLSALSTACTFHFAGHAVVDSDLPQHSHLRLAGGEKLTWIDLQTLSIRPDLVVLSACETGRGMTPAAGERWGLATGFLSAGAASVVASGWKVPDEPSRALVERFYAEVDTAGPAEALRRAQRALLAGEAGPDAARPLAWGAFSVFGDPGGTAAPSSD